MSLRRRTVWRRLVAVGLIAVGLPCFAQTATEEDEAYPSRPIKIIVPFSPGGSTDAMARLVKREIELRNLLPQPLVVVNIEGAGSAIGSRRAKNAKPDGYTLLVLNEAIITSKYWGTVPYGPEAFEPIAGTGEAGTILTVREDSRFESLGDMLEEAKRNPGTVKAAVALGTPSHFACLGAQSALPGAELRHAQFGGGAHRFAALKGGHVDLTTFSTDEFRRFRQEGLRGLAYLAKQRNPDIPDVPTALEQGFDVQRSIMLYWWAPKGTPEDRIAVIRDALEQAMQGEALQQRMAETSIDPVFLSGRDLSEKLMAVEAAIQSVDPRRTADLPKVVLWTTLAIVVLTLWSIVEHLRAGHSIVTDEVKKQLQPKLLPMLAALGLTCAFVGLLVAGWLPMWLTIAAFMLACGAALGAFRSRTLGIALVALSLFVAVNFDFVFTYLFVIDL